MTGFTENEYCCRRRVYKRWRYPGVPVPARLRDQYRDPTAPNRISF